MDINLWLVVGLLTAHLMADFFTQSDWVAVNKSKRLDALLVHVVCYSIIMALASSSLSFAAVTFVAHFCTDWVTSRIARRYWPFLPTRNPKAWLDGEGTINWDRFLGRPWKRSRHNFFCTIGVDQWLHAVQLLLTAYWLL